MSTEQTTNPDVTVTDNLDDFAAELFGETKQTSGSAKPEEAEVEVEDTDDALPEEVDTQSEETEDDDTLAPDDEDDETKKAEKPEKKNRLQERINELTAARREAERKYEKLLAKLEENTKPKTVDPVKEQATNTQEQAGPSASDKNEDGTDKYPLGEFDPKFVKDTVQHMLNEQARIQKEEAAKQAKVSEEDQYRSTLQNSWNEKLDDVKERYPDFEDKGQEMLAVFEGIDQAYGQYLTDTLMEMDAGPEVFYYLANNLDKAEEIVNAGPRKATIALAKIEAQLVGTPTKTAAVKTTNAPPPPPQVKGSAVSKASVSVDTDDLDAFSKMLFKKK
jgi:hypothetical protein